MAFSTFLLWWSRKKSPFDQQFRRGTKTCIPAGKPLPLHRKWHLHPCIGPHRTSFPLSHLESLVANVGGHWLANIYESSPEPKAAVLGAHCLAVDPQQGGHSCRSRRPLSVAMEMCNQGLRRAEREACLMWANRHHLWWRGYSTRHHTDVVQFRV